MEYYNSSVGVQGYILRLAVLASPHISNAEFRETLLLKRLVNIIVSAGEATRNQAMVCFCVLLRH